MQKGTNTEWLLEGFKYDLESTKSQETVKYYCGEVDRFLRWAKTAGVPSDIHLITKHHIQAFFHHLADTRRAANGSSEDISDIIERHRWPYYRSLKRFFDWACDEGYIEKTPLDSIDIKSPLPPPIEPYQAKHVIKMTKVLDYHWQTAKTPRQKMLAARNKAILFLLAETGLRLKEMAKLTLDSIDLEKQRVVVRFGKMGKSRLGGFGPQTKKALWRYLSLRPTEVNGNALWVTEEGRPLKRSGLRMVIRRLKEEADLQHVKGSVHKMRHTFATAYLRQTRDMKGCRLLLGHSTLAMTERYTEYIDAEDALENYDGKGPLDWLIG